MSPRTLESARCRIEHGGMIPTAISERITALGAWVVTNPGFIHYRGPKYAAEPGLLPYLYRARSLLDADVQLAGAQRRAGHSGPAADRDRGRRVATIDRRRRTRASRSESPCSRKPSTLSRLGRRA